MSLPEWRKEIDRIDEQVIQLLNRRAELATRARKYIGATFDWRAIERALPELVARQAPIRLAKR